MAYKRRRAEQERKRIEKIREEPVQYKQYLEKERLKKRKRMQRIREDPVQYAQYLEKNRLKKRKSKQRKGAMKRKMNEKRATVKACDNCGLCILCRGFTAVS